MGKNDLKVLDTIETPDYMTGEIADEDGEMEIPKYMIPPNPDETDELPSNTHPSYPYGNPTDPRHPAAKSRPAYDPTSRALYEDMGLDVGGITAAIRWNDLALDDLLPVDEKREVAKKAMQARKMASGTANNNPQPHNPQAMPIVDDDDDLLEEDEDEDDDDEVDENEDDEDESGEEDEEEEVEDSEEE